MSETFILCEGYHDRAFWQGWLLHLGCTDLGIRPGRSARITPLDPWNKPVGKGQYAYKSPSDRFIRVVPCGGRSNVLPAARLRLTERITNPLLRLVINVDPDIDSGGTGPATGLRSQDVLALAQTFDPHAKAGSDGDIELDDGATRLSLVRWEVGTGPASGVPAQQTLERLVCSALVAAYPARAAAVQGWLDSRPTPPVADPKEHAWSYMAGWYAEHGCEFFYSNVWRDTTVVGALRNYLTVSGAWAAVERLAL